MPTDVLGRSVELVRAKTTDAATRRVGRVCVCTLSKSIDLGLLATPQPAHAQGNGNQNGTTNGFGPMTLAS